MLKLIYTITLTIVFQILPSTPMTYEVVDHGQVFIDLWTLEVTVVK